jgi:DNA polymerase I
MLSDVLDALNDAEKKQSKRISRVPKIINLESELERLSALKWGNDINIFETVRDALLSKELVRTVQGRMKKEEIYGYWKKLELHAREAKKQQVRDSKPSNFFIVQDLRTWNAMQKIMFSETLAAWDTETTGLNYMADRIVGISAYFPKADVAFYAPFAHKTGEKQLNEEQILTPIKEWLEDEENKSIWHNFKYDGHLLANHNIQVKKPYWDTLVAARLLNEHEENHKLKCLYDKYCTDSKEKSVLFEDIVDEGKIADTDVLLAGVYAAYDPYKTFKMYAFQKPYIDIVGNIKTAWYQIEQKLLPVDVRVERNGLRVDIARLKEIKEEQLPKIAEAESNLKKAFNINEDFLKTMGKRFGRVISEFNYSSNDHLGYLIYEVLNVGEEMPQRFGKKAGSTSADVLDAIIKDIPALEPILKYRELNKLVNTYAAKIPEALEIDRRLHSSFNSFGTATGRYSSSAYGPKNNKKGTNLQNIPGRTELGKEIRKCIIPDEGEIFVSSDLSQIEPRQIANLLYLWCNDNSMRQLYLDGVDLYTTMAMKVFNLDEEYCVDGAYDPTHKFKPRSVMKTGVLATLYGQSVKSFAKKMGVSDEVAKQFFDGMDSSFPGINPFREKVLKQLREHGYVETLFGRKRRFPDYQRKYARLQSLNRKPWKILSYTEAQERNELWRYCAKCEREAVNCVIQGTSADILKQIIIAMDAVCQERGWRLMMSIHDEIMISMPKSDLTIDSIEVINEIMTRTVTCSVPLKCDTVIQPRWMVEYKPKDWDFEKSTPKEIYNQ